MKTKIWKMIDGHDTAGLSDEQRAAIAAELKRESEELMRQCAERKAERLAEKAKSEKIN